MTAIEDRLEAAGASLTSRVRRSRLLLSQDYVRHGVTSRVAGLGRADGNVGYSPPRDKEDAWAMRGGWCRAIGVDAERIVTLGQIHGNDVHRVEQDQAGTGARPGSGQVALGDALVTDRPDVVLMTLHADCLPILLVDPDRPAVGAVHAGWRGTVADVAGATVRAMVGAFATRPERLLAFLGPAIGPCCYEVGGEVAEQWLARGGRGDAAVAPDGGRWRFDLRRANYHLLVGAGVDPTRVELSDVCTRCAGDRWFSHRGQGPATGRYGAIISLTAGGDPS